MIDLALESFLAEGRVSQDVSFPSLLFFIGFGGIGVALAMNFRDAADRFFWIVSKVMVGFTGSATPRTLRFVGAVVALLSVIGIVVEVSKILRS